MNSEDYPIIHALRADPELRHLINEADNDLDWLVAVMEVLARRMSG